MSVTSYIVSAEKMNNDQYDLSEIKTYSSYQKPKYSFRKIFINTITGLFLVGIGIFFIELSRSGYKPSTGMMFIGLIAFFSGLMMMILPGKLKQE